MRKFLLVFIFSVFASSVLATGTWQSCNGVGPVGSVASVCNILVMEAGDRYVFSHTDCSNESACSCYANYKNEDGSPTGGSADMIGSACKISAEEPKEEKPKEKEAEKPTEDAAEKSAPDTSTSKIKAGKQGGTHHDTGKNAAKSSAQNSSAKKADICKQVSSMFTETLANELPPSKTNGATIAVGAIAVGNDIKSWVAGASSIIGADGNFTVSNIGKPSTSKYDYYAQGIRLNEPSNVRACKTNQLFKYPNNPARPLQGHAESKIIEDWFKNGATKNATLYLKIGGAQTQPCTNCGNLIQFVNNGGSGCPKVKVCP
jgi:hypothetical protein